MGAFLVRVSGVVQGVGFRPFVYRLAVQNDLAGFVKNSGTDAEIFAQGEDEKIKNFLEALAKPAPPILIEKITRKQAKPQDMSGFMILESASEPAHSPLPPDSAICPDCLRELRDRKDRRFGYEFTNCTVCGPRFSILDSPPFDRKNTSFRNFKKCPQCGEEYSSPKDRRFYAQTICCSNCGPHYFSYYKDNLLAENPVKKTAQLLSEGAAVVVKGWGGMHVAVDATNEQAVRDLRKKLLRPHQPFAVMARDLAQAKNCALISKEEESILLSPARPIVVADKKGFLARSVSSLHNVGIMLPYSALHFLLFQEIGFPLVFTSANISSLPMEIDNDSVRSLPFNHFLLHNLAIENRTDDSVFRVVDSNPVFLRRSRGFVPLPIPVSSKRSILAFGAEWQNTACLLSGDGALLTQHIGNCNTAEVIAFLESSIKRLLNWKRARSEIIACDLHPNFLTTRLAREYAENYNADFVQVQHHEAHLAGVMAEHGLGEAVGIICDGTGYAKRGVSWGGEVFHSDRASIERVGHLSEVPMPGGDLSAIDPRRMLAGFLHESMGRSEFKRAVSQTFGEHETKPLLNQIKESPRTSSAGRFLDAVSALLGVCSRRTYEGEPAMRLESFARGAKKHVRLKYSIKNNIVDTPAFVCQLARAFKKDPSRSNARALAYSAQQALADSLFEVALSASKERGCRNIAVSGGVFYNGHISSRISGLCKKNGLFLFRHLAVPCGDGGVSFGQACFADRMESSSR